LLLAALIIAGCARASDAVERFDEAVRRGAGCEELLRLRENIEVPDRDVHLRVDRTLDDLGCTVFIEDAFG